MPGVTYFSGVLQVKAYKVLQQHVSKEVKQFGLNATQWFIIGQIHEQKQLRAADLAKLLQVEAPLITNLTEDLVRKSLIEKVDVASDKRAKLLRLSRKGSNLVPMVEKNLQAKLSELLSGLSSKDLRAYDRVLQTIVKNAQSAG